MNLFNKESTSVKKNSFFGGRGWGRLGEVSECKLTNVSNGIPILQGTTVPNFSEIHA